MKRLLKFTAFILIINILSLFVSCSIETYATKKISADSEILLYIENNQLDVRPNQSGLVFIPLEDGNGEYPQDGDKVAFHYTGYFMDGEVFETSYDKPYPLIVELGNGMIIRGLEESLKMMNKSSTAKVIVPFYLAYNDMENAPVPPFSNLIFELKLIDFTPVEK